MIYVSEQHKVIGVPASPELTGMWPDAQVMPYNGGNVLLLPHGLGETIVLRRMGYQVPAPILTQYAWPHPPGEPPFYEQRMTAALFTTNQRCYCLNGLGTGKTRSAIYAFDYLRGNEAAKAALVVCPLSIMDSVWRKEIFQINPRLKVGIVYGSREQRLKVLRQKHDVYVINTDGIKVVPEILEQMFKAGKLDTLILDELSLFRNGGAIRNKVARQLSYKAVWLWGMTGEPTPNEPTDAWGQCRVVTPGTVPKYFSWFRDMTMLKVGTFTYAPKKEANDIVFRCMQPAVRYALDDVVELPPQVERMKHIPLSRHQTEAYERLRNHGYAALANREISAQNAGVVLNKLLQISLGFVYTQTGEIVSFTDNDRLDALAVDVNGTDRKVLVFVPFTHALNGVFSKLAGDNIEVAAVDGSVSKRERDEIFHAFQHTSKYKALVAHPACMAHGLTLTAADTVIWFGPTTSFETFDQANARIRRVGQKHKQLILMYEGTPTERKMWTRLRNKQRVQANLLDLFADFTPEVIA